MTPVIKIREYSCDNCGTIHKISTNHEGRVFNRCNNWCCHRPAQLRPMSFYKGKSEIVTSEFYDSAAQNKVKLPVDPVQYQAWLATRNKD